MVFAILFIALRIWKQRGIEQSDLNVVWTPRNLDMYKRNVQTISAREKKTEQAIGESNLSQNQYKINKNDE